LSKEKEDGNAMGENGKTRGHPEIPNNNQQGMEEEPLSPAHADVPLPPASDLIIDERLTSAAAPFLYLLSIILIAVAAYFLYIFFRG
jgi:hypothetical protein